MKACKQCGQNQEDESFRPYVPRGAGKYKTKVGRQTICRNCEALNAKAARIHKMEEEERSVDQQVFLDKMADAYRELKRRGCEPVGAYAAYVFGDAAKTRGGISDDLMMASMLGAWDEVMQQLTDFLNAHWDDTPDVYSDLLDEIVDPGAVQEKYRELYNKCLDKQANYEDNYQW